MKIPVRFCSIAALLISACAVQSDDAEPALVEILGAEEATVAFGTEAILDVSVRPNDDFSQVFFEVDAETAEAIGALTLASLGGPISVAVCGEVVSQPMVVEPIDGGQMALTGFSEDEAEALGAVLAGDKACVFPEPAGEEEPAE